MKTFVILVALVAIATVSANFDCRREAGLCQNGGTCNNDGTCACDTSLYEGYDCSVVTADKADAACTTNPCNNGGTCHKASAAATATCLCAPGYTGATCDDQRYEVTCNNDDTMDITIRPFVDTFTGIAIVEGQTDASCELTGTPLAITALSNTDATCGSTDDQTVSGDVHKTRSIIVQFIDGTVTSRDIRVLFTCGTDPVLEKTYATVTIQAVQANLQEEAVGNVPLDGDVDFGLEVSGAAVTAPVDLGTDVEIKADLTAEGLMKFPAIRFKTCSIANGDDISATGYVSKNIISSYCPDETDGLQSLITSPLERDTNAVKFTFSAFKYDTTTDLVVTCVIQACTTTAACDPESCTGDAAGAETGYGRKKRDTGSVDKELTRKVSVNDPLGAAAKTLQEFAESKACYQSWEMTATVVALAVALLLVILLCIILVVKAILNRRSSDVYREDISETASTSHLPHLPTIVSNKA